MHGRRRGERENGRLRFRHRTMGDMCLSIGVMLTAMNSSTTGELDCCRNRGAARRSWGAGEGEVAHIRQRKSIKARRSSSSAAARESRPRAKPCREPLQGGSSARRGGARGTTQSRSALIIQRYHRGLLGRKTALERGTRVHGAIEACWVRRVAARKQLAHAKSARRSHGCAITIQRFAGRWGRRRARGKQYIEKLSSRRGSCVIAR